MHNLFIHSESVKDLHGEYPVAVKPTHTKNKQPVSTHKIYSHESITENPDS